MDALVTILGFMAGFGLVWFIANRRDNKRPHIQPPIGKIQLILAGNFSQYRYYVQRHYGGVNNPKTRYISSIEAIRGHHGSTADLRLIGTYRERADWREIVAYAIQHDIDMPDTVD